MVIYCKHCGAALRVDDARIPATTFRVKCHRCQNLLTVEPPKPGAPPAKPVTPAAAAPTAPPRAAPQPPAAAAPAAAPRPASPPARPAAQARTAAAVAPPPPRPAVPPPVRTHYLQKIRLFSPLSYDECLMLESLLKPREFAPQQVIVKEGGPGDSMYFIQ
jgi:predicted Zn finger-like uncharacterized protein